MQGSGLQGFRLSPQQRHLWRFSLGAQGGFSQCALLLEGTLENGSLRRAVQKVVADHEILRTTFRRLAGVRVPFQVVGEQAGLAWSETDLSGEANLPAAVERLLGEQRSRGFDYEEGPLVDCAFLALGPARSLLALRLPVLCADSRSLANLASEIGRRLSNGGEGDTDREQILQYLQFSEWQNEILEDAENQAGRDFWRERAAGPAPLRLPFEGEPAEPAAWSPSALQVVLAPERAARLEAACRAEGVELAVFLLACWQVLLWRLTGAPEIAVATVYDGRKFAELEAALGPFARSIPLAVRIEEGLRFRDVLQRVKRSFQEAHDWQEYFVWPEEDEAAAGMAFELLETPPAVAAGPVRLSLQDPRSCSEPFKVKLLARKSAGEIRLELQWDGRALSSGDVRAMADQLATLVSSAAAAGTAVEDLDLLSPEERQRLLVDVNRTAVAWPDDLPVHRRFEAQARLRPERPALQFEDQRLAYGELNARSNRLARRLRELGVGPEVPVGLLLERSAEMVVAMLAVLKAGGAYLPLDPALPARRLAAMVAAAGAPVVVTREALQGRLEGHGARLHRLEEPLSHLSETDLPGGALPGNLAYVLFTSGSTGTPKGVAVEHRQLANYLQAVAVALALPADSSYATVSTFAADLGNTAIFPALCGGGLLHVIAQERTLDPEAFADYLGRHEVDCLKIVPSHLSTLFSGSRPAAVLPRRLLVVGGEASSRELVATVRRLAPELRILNHYGPTEATVGAMTCPVEKEDALRPSLPLGGPLANTRVYVLRGLRPMAAGETGELYLGGAGLARGYLGQPAETAARFLPDPFSADPGERLYRTGDLARFLSPGAVEFLGRADHQVKIRGFRVELGEIESALRSHPALREAVVVLREDAPGEKRLVAYALAPPAGRPGEAELREHLRASLAEHMLPSAVVWMEALPIGPNGKLDRRALPAPERAQPEAGREAVAPRTLGEEMLIELWREILRGPSIGVHDNFFALGGDSLQAIQLVSRVRAVFGVELPVRSLFASPTIAGLAQALDRAAKGESGDEAFRLEPVPRTGDLPLSFAQQRLWFMYRMNPDSGAYNTSIPVRLRGRLDVAAFGRAVDEVARRHEVLRTTFPDREGEPVQIIHPAGSVPLPLVDLSALPPAGRDREALRLASAHAQRPFDLTTGPTLRILLLAVAPESWILVVTLSHIVSDGWSRDILIRELAALYDAFSQGRPSPFAEPLLQYADFAAWQRRWLQGDVLERHLAYWRRQLAGAAEAAVALPTDRPRTPGQSFRGDHLGSTLSASLTQAIHELCRGEGVTLFMTLLAAFKVLLSRSTGVEDVVVGTDTANRTRLELEGLIGFFVNNLVLRTSLAGNPTFREVLARVRETTLGAYLHQDLPFELLVRELQPRRSLGQTPLFQVLFVLQNTPTSEVAIPTLKVAPVDIEFGLSKFDLAVFVTPVDDGLTVTWSYKTDLFDRSTVARLSSRFETLLESIVGEPDAPVSKLEILTAAEREQREREQGGRRQARLDRLRRGAQ